MALRPDILVHKQTFGPSDLLHITVPIGSKLLDIAEDIRYEGWFAVWYERPIYSPGELTIKLYVVPTGYPWDVTNTNTEYWKTIHTSNGLVWHIYKERENTDDGRKTTN